MQALGDSDDEDEDSEEEDEATPKKVIRVDTLFNCTNLVMLLRVLFILQFTV